MFVAKRYLLDLVKIHRKHPVPTDGGTWYPMACKFLKLKHHLHSFFTKKRKALSKELCSTLKIEPNALTTTFHTKERTAN